MLTNSGFSDDSYDQTLFGGASCPLTAVRNTRPVIIIDEPHRIKRESRACEAVQQLEPQMILRFGATFPEKKIGRGKDAQTIKDYYRGTPQFDLGAVEAFNQDLVKGVSVQFPSLAEESVKRYRVAGVSARKLTLKLDKRLFEIGVGEPLPPDFEGGVTYESSGLLSNGLEVRDGMELLPGVFASSYQELLLKQALDAHFEAEIANFHREAGRVKTCALFFIDSIKSYRDRDGWLKTTFEKLLGRKINAVLRYTRQSLSAEYRAFLEATRKNIAASHGGYFAKDWGEADESAAAEEREDILHKERTLPFKKDNGAWNIRRFFFSKWTLREGWDHPNVFTICKLRTSGSEMSKIQEVGRGLRLPVDEAGNRLSGCDWHLSFIIGYDEKDFAEKLIGEINRDARLVLDTHRLTPEMLRVLCEETHRSEEEMLDELDNAGIIKRSNDFKDGGYEKLIERYPCLLHTQLRRGKVRTNGEKPKKVKLRVDNWEKIRGFWEEISRRYMLTLQRLPAGEAEKLMQEVLETEGVFDDNAGLSLVIQNTQKESGTVTLTEETVRLENPGLIGSIAYGEFVQRLAKRTALPVSMIHALLWKRLSGIYKTELVKTGDAQKAIAVCNAHLNQTSLANITARWSEKFAETFAAKYHYDALSFSAETSVLKNGSFLDELEAGIVGVNQADDVPDDPRSLYQRPLFYDSEVEHDTLKIKPPPEITVFGKIPRRAIKVPTYTGGSTTPDFIYSKETVSTEAVCEPAPEYGDAAHRTLTLLVETKHADMRGAEKRAVDAQERLFQKVKGVKWRLAASPGAVAAALEKIFPDSRHCRS